MFDSPLFVRTRRVVEDNAWWIIILASSLGGLTFLALSIYPFGEGGLVTRHIKPTDLQALLKSVGTAVLSGGVFAAILKALQFARIFQEELSIVIYDPKFLERRTDIETVWGEVSDILYKRKFPAIKDEIRKEILKTYLPTAVNYYYDRFEQDIEYKLLPESSDYMQVTEIINFTVKSVSKTEEIRLPFSSRILKRTDDKKTAFEVLEIKVNNKPKTVEDQPQDNGTFLEAAFLLDLTGEEEYEIYIKAEKTLCPDVDNHKTFATSKIVNNFELDVRYPDGIDMGFFSMGTPGEFHDRGSSKNRVWKSYKGLIFPQQGYRIALSRK